MTAQRERVLITGGSGFLGACLAHNLVAEGHDVHLLMRPGFNGWRLRDVAGRMRSTDLLEPRTDYAVAKAAATLLCQAEARRGLPVTTVRVFSAYGPWEEPTRLVPYVMGCCYRGEDPRCTAGLQPRDFIYADDVLRLLKLAAHHPAAR